MNDLHGLQRLGFTAHLALVLFVALLGLLQRAQRGFLAPFQLLRDQTILGVGLVVLLLGAIDFIAQPLQLALLSGADLLLLLLVRAVEGSFVLVQLQWRQRCKKRLLYVRIHPARSDGRISRRGSLVWADAAAAIVRCGPIRQRHLMTTVTAVAQPHQKSRAATRHTLALSSAMMRVVIGEDGLNAHKSIPIYIAAKVVFE